MQALADLPQDRCHALVVQRHELAILEFLELAEALAQRPRCLHLLGHEAHLVRRAVQPVVERRFDAVEALLCLLRQHGAQVRLEALVREVLEAVEADHFAIRTASCDSFYEQVCRPAAGVQGDGLVQSIQLAAADGEDLELGEPRLVIGIQEHGALARGGHVPDHRSHTAARRPYGNLLQQRAEHLHAAGAPGQAQEGQAGLGCDGPVDPEGVVHQHALRAAPQGQEEARGVRLQQRRTKAQVALDLLVGQDAAVRGHVARGRHRASEQLGEVRRGGVQGSRRIDGDILVQRDAGRSKGGQQRVVDGPQHDGGAPELGGLHKTGGRKARARDVGRQRAVLQGGDPAVDGRDRASEGVEGRHQRVAAVALGLAPAVRLDLDDAEVAQDPPPGEGRPEEQAADELGRELLLDEVEEAVALGHRGVPSEVPGVERREAAAAQVPPVRFRLGIGVAGELERGVREDGGGRQGRPGQEGLDHGRRHVGAHQGLEARVGADREVARVCLRLGQEARAGDGVVDLALNAPAGPVLREGRCQQRIQLGAGIKPKQLAGHVALRFGLRVVIREIHVSQGVCDLLIDFGPGVEVQQGRDDLRIDLGAVVVAGKGRGDGRGHRAAGGVVGQLARHVGRDLRLVPVGRQLAGDEGQHVPAPRSGTGTS